MLHHIPVSNETLPRIKPIVAGYEDCKKGHSYGPAVRHQWLIHYVESGIGYFEIGGKQYTLTSGNIFVIPPYVEIFYAADKEKPWSYIWVGFEVEGKLPCKLEDTLYLPKAKKLFDTVKQSEKLSSTRAAFLTARIWELFALIIENEPNSVDPTETMRDIIHSEYAYGVTVSEIAERLNMNRSYLSIVFKEKFGVSPKRYLMELRMNMAAALLQRGKSVKIAANSVGYSDMFIFSKAFKGYYGCSPSQYAKKYR